MSPAPYYIEGNCGQLAMPPYACEPCPVKEKGRVRHVALVHKTFTFADPTNVNEWIAGINSGLIIIIPRTRGEVGEPSEVLEEGYGEVEEVLIGYDFTSSFNVDVYVENYDFFNTLKDSKEWEYWYMTETLIHETDTAATFIPKNAVEPSTKSSVRWKVDVKWTSKNLAKPYVMPAGIFDGCFIPEQA